MPQNSGGERERRARRPRRRPPARGGERAAGRGDAGGAVKLLERASSLIPQDDPARREVQVELASALVERGELKAAKSAFTELIAAAHAAGEEVVEWRARLGLLATEIWLGNGTRATTPRSVREAIPVLERHGDDLGLARAWLSSG